MKTINSVALHILGIAKSTVIMLGTFSEQTNYLIVKMDDFDVVQRIQFLLERKVILMPQEKCMVIKESNPTIV